MASGRKHASFRPRSQSDNGVIIELTPLSVGGCISRGLLPGPCGCSAPAGPGGEVLSLAFWRCRQWGLDVRVHGSPCVGPACGRSVVRSIGDIFCRRRAGLFCVPLTEEMVEGLNCMGGPSGSQAWVMSPVTAAGGFWKRQGLFSLCCL